MAWIVLRSDFLGSVVGRCPDGTEFQQLDPQDFLDCKWPSPWVRRASAGIQDFLWVPWMSRLRVSRAEIPLNAKSDADTILRLSVLYMMIKGSLYTLFSRIDFCKLSLCPCTKASSGWNSNYLYIPYKRVHHPISSLAPIFFIERSGIKKGRHLPAGTFDWQIRVQIPARGCIRFDVEHSRCITRRRCFRV